MELIPMTDFVLEIEADIKKEDYEVVKWQNKIFCVDRIFNYANFLKQPLELKMFVSDNKDDILFDGFEIYENIETKHKSVICPNKIFHVFWEDDITKEWKLSKGLKTIEDLISYELETTKQF